MWLEEIPWEVYSQLVRDPELVEGFADHRFLLFIEAEGAYILKPFITVNDTEYRMLEHGQGFWTYTSPDRCNMTTHIITVLRAAPYLNWDNLVSSYTA